MKLSDTQLIVLSAAAQREDRGIALPPKLRGGAAQKFAAKLLREGLVEEVRARGMLPVWRRDDSMHRVDHLSRNESKAELPTMQGNVRC